MLYKGSYEDLIYILIGIIWIAYSIYKGVNKKKARQLASAKGPGRTRAKNFFESFMDEMAGQDEKPMEYVPKEVETEVVSEKLDETPEKRIFSFDDVYEESNFQEEKEVYKPNTDVEETPVEKLTTLRKPQRKQLHFDIRKAVIYSEILKTPYF